MIVESEEIELTTVLWFRLNLNSTLNSPFFCKIQLEEKYQVEDCKYRTQEHDIISWHYKGMLLNGKVFDEGNYKAQLGHRTIIHGVDQGMRGLCIGEKRRMTMHPDWAYGTGGTGKRMVI